MRILFLTHYFPPEVNAPATRTHEHCREWVAAGHEVHVVTCVPSHPAGVPFPGHRTGWYAYEQIDGVHVHRVWTYLAANKGLVRRTLNYLSFIPSAAFRALRLGRFDVAVGTSPQFFCAVATWLVGVISRVPWIFELRDLWPESIPAVGAMRPNAALRLLERLELRMYRDAVAVVCLTQSFVDNLRRRGVPARKLHLIPNGVIPEFWRSDARDATRRAQGVTDGQVVASYIGTIGMAHGLDTVLAAAEGLLAAAPSVRLWIVGDGAQLGELRSTAAQRGLTNVTFTGQVPRADIPALLAASDMSLVTLRPSEVFKTVLPSKMFEAMAARSPIVLGVEGEARATLERAGAGLAVKPGDPQALAEAIVALGSDQARRFAMGEAGAAFVEREFSRRAWAARYLAMFAETGRQREVAVPATSRSAMN